MQAIIIMALFSLVLSIAGGIAIGSGPNTQQMVQMQVQQMQEYMRNVEIIMNDITRNELEAAPSTVTDMVPYIQSNQNLMQLSSGRWADPALDAWGNPLKGYVVRENRVLYVNGTDKIVAVVTGVVLASAGPDREFQTSIPTVTTIAALQGILPPVGSDDIVAVFTDEATQQDLWQGMMTRMRRIANAELNDYQLKLGTYKLALEEKYRQEIAETGAVTSPSLEVMLKTDPDAPQYADLNSTAGRLALGVDSDFSALERTWGNGGRMKVTSTSNADGTLTLQLVNDPLNPTIWGSGGLQYTMIIQGSV